MGKKLEIKNVGEEPKDKRIRSRAKINCFLVCCPNCKFEQQTLSFNATICNNADCKKEIDVQKNLIKIVNGGEGGLHKFPEENQNDN
jgi:hypothetical protein